MYKGAHTFQKMNVISQQEFELTYFKIAVKYVSHYASWYKNISSQHASIYLLTPLLEENATQCQFLTRGLTGLNSVSFFNFVMANVLEE